MTNIGLGPSAPQRCTERFLTETYALAEDNDLAWHIHVQETKSQILTAQRWYGRSFIEVLAGMSLLGPRTSVVHAVWLTNRDIELLQQTDTTMIHCLLSNLRLGDGVAPVPDLMEQGVRIALGTDGRGCDESLDMVELVKMTDVVHKVHGNHYDRWPSVDEIFEMATHNGGVPTRRAERIGRIAPGYLGDLILVSLDELAFSPLNHPLRQFVFGAASDRVHTVIVDGNIVVSEGEARRVDEAEVRSAARELAERDAKLSGDPDRAGELARVVRRMYEEIEASDVGINSYIGPSFSGRGPRT